MGVAVSPVRGCSRDGNRSCAGAVVRIAALALLLAGCAVNARGLDAPAAQDATEGAEAPAGALAIVLASYGAPAQPGALRVQWVAGRPECGGIAWIEAGHCVRGMFETSRPDVIVVATWPGALIAQTSFAHETRHWLLFHTNGDTGHGGDFYARVDAANEALWRAE